MSIFLYQIGMDRITATPTSFAGLQVDLPRTFKTSVSQSGRVPHTIFNGITQFPEPMEISLTGTFMCSGCESVSDQFNRLLSMGGKPYIDVIGYLPNDCCCTSESCGKCGNCSGNKPVTWLTTVGVIESVDRGYAIEGDTPYPGSMMEVSFKITLDTYWYPMNPYTWYPQYGAEPYDSFHQDQTLVKSILPTQVLGNSTFSFWKRNYADPFALYNPELWSEMYKFDDATGRVRVLSDGSPIIYRVRSPRTRWAAPPVSLYCFENFDNDGVGGVEPQISVQSELRPFYTETFLAATTNMDATLNQVKNDPLIDGYHNELIQLIVTDGLYRPSFFRYGNSAILTVANQFSALAGFPIIPNWEYETSNPGELLGLDNIISITAPVGVKVSYLHTFRGL